MLKCYEKDFVYCYLYVALFSFDWWIVYISAVLLVILDDCIKTDEGALFGVIVLLLLN